MEKVVKRELLEKLMWDYNFPTEELEAVLEGRKLQAGHYTRSMLFKKIIETYPWFTVIELFLPEDIRQLLTKDLIQKLRVPSIREKYGTVYGRLQEVNCLATMKLSDLIKSNNWLSVELTLLRLYPDQEKMLDEYRNVFEKLRITEPEEYELEIVLNENDSDPNFENDKKTFIDVSGRKKLADPNSLTDSYAIEFVEWKNWLGMDIAPQTIKQFTDLEIIVHCIYEMTFNGYDEEEIQGQLKLLNDRFEEYNNLTEEEKKEKTITLDELLKLFDENNCSS